jgi:hypothetical protein
MFKNKNNKGANMEKGTKQDLEMLISDLDNFYSYRGRKFFKLLDEDERIDLEDRCYNLYNDLQDKLDELEKESNPTKEVA